MHHKITPSSAWRLAAERNRRKSPSCRRAALSHCGPSQALSMTGVSRRRGAASGSRRPSATCSPGSDYCDRCLAHAASWLRRRTGLQHRVISGGDARRNAHRSAFAETAAPCMANRAKWVLPGPTFRKGVLPRRLERGLRLWEETTSALTGAVRSRRQRLLGPSVLLDPAAGGGLFALARSGLIGRRLSSVDAPAGRCAPG
jgi:hypothetical protein